VFVISPTINIKRATSNDWLLFKNLRLKAFKQEPKAFPSSFEEFSNYKDSYWIDMLNTSDNIVLIAYDGITPIGLIRAALKDEDVLPNTALIGSLYVIDQFRGTGIGKKLLIELINIVSQQENIKFLRLWVTETQLIAIDLYKSLGFTLIDKVLSVDSSDSTPINELIFEKPL